MLIFHGVRGLSHFFPEAIHHFWGTSNSLRKLWLKWERRNRLWPWRLDVFFPSNLPSKVNLWTPNIYIVFSIWGGFCISRIDWFWKIDSVFFVFLRVGFSNGTSMTSCAIPSYDMISFQVDICWQLLQTQKDDVACSRFFLISKK